MFAQKELPDMPIAALALTCKIEMHVIKYYGSLYLLSIYTVC